MVVCSLPCSQSVSSALTEVRKMDISTRDVLDYGVLKGSRGNVRIERSGRLDYLHGGEEQRVFSCFAHTWLGRWKLLSCG